MAVSVCVSLMLALATLGHGMDVVHHITLPYVLERWVSRDTP